MPASLSSVALAFAFSIVANCAAAASTSSMTNISEQLRVICSDRSLSYQRLLHDASHEVRRVALGRSWSEIDPVLRQQGLQQILARDHDYFSDYRYLVAQEGWRGGDQTAHSLYLEFNVDRRTSNTVASAKPGYVMIAKAGLLVELNRPYSQILTNSAYPEGSVLFRGLRLPEAVDVAGDYPILKKIEITYDFIRDRWLESVPQGFGLRLTFGDSPRDSSRPATLEKGSAQVTERNNHSSTLSFDIADDVTWLRFDVE